MAHSNIDACIEALCTIIVTLLSVLEHKFHNGKRQLYRNGSLRWTSIVPITAKVHYGPGSVIREKILSMDGDKTQ